jgi:UDP-2,4-diacetamido-2,4,6-trideoxy-beta-L-altropyranose hydrolase
VNRVYIRADGDAQIGIGHLVRCIALAHSIRKHFAISFVCKAIPAQLQAELAHAGIGLILISEEQDFFSRIGANDIVVLDGYHFDTNYQSQIKAAGAKLVCIDDMYDKVFYADLIINHSPGVTPADYQAQSYTRFALGLEYALLRPAFLTESHTARSIEKIESVLICFGGSDYQNFTKQILLVVLQFPQIRNITVVTGTAYRNLDELKSLFGRESRVSLFHAVKEHQMVALMRETDLAIVPASGVMIEALSQRLLVISGHYIENQKKAYHAALAAGFIVGVGDFSTFDTPTFQHALKEANGKINAGPPDTAAFGRNKLGEVFNLLK